MQIANISKVQPLIQEAQELTTFRDELKAAKEGSPNPAKKKRIGIMAVMVGAVGNAGRKTRVILPDCVQENVDEGIVEMVTQRLKAIETEIADL